MAKTKITKLILYWVVFYSHRQEKLVARVASIEQPPDMDYQPSFSGYRGGKYHITVAGSPGEAISKAVKEGYRWKLER